MIVLKQFARPKPGQLGDVPNPSPFCWKLEAYLRMTKLEHTVDGSEDPRKAPRGKMPYIVDDGTIVGDSALAIDHLKKKHGDVLGDDKLSPADVATALVARRMIEEHLYWAIVYTRWISDEGWAHMREYLAGVVPAAARMFLGMIRKSVRDQAYGAGMGRHTASEIYSMGNDDLDALSAMLGDNKYFLGDAPHAVDATLTAFLGSILVPPIDTPMQRHLKKTENLKSYFERTHAEWFGDLKKGAAA